MKRWFGIALLLAGCGASTEPSEQSLLFVVWDTTRADHLSTYGYSKATSPRLDRLAARGVRFDGVRSASSLTPVSAASFMTGELPIRTGVRSLFTTSKQALSPDVKPLAELLQESGRRTAGFVSAPPIGSRYGLDRGFDVFDDDVKSHAAALRKAKVGNAYQRRADVTTDLALGWLDDLDQGDSFGLFVHYFDAHDPSRVPPRDYLAPRVSFELPGDLDQVGHLDGLFDGAEHGRGGPRAADLVELYDAEIEYMDWQLGRLLDRLDGAGRLESTLVVVLADHGESLGQHDFWTHGLMWDEQLRVPLVMGGPGVPKGIALAETVSSMDLLPSLGELLDFDVPDGIQGRSLVGLFDPQAAWSDRPVFAEVHNPVGDRTGRPQQQFAVTAWPWKLIVEPGSAALLYNLAEDPGELDNLYAVEHPAARALGAALLATGARDADGLVDLDQLDAAEREMLIKLGYL